MAKRLRRPTEGGIVLTQTPLRISFAGGGTDLVLRHEKFATEDMAEKHREGWGGFVEQLAAYLGGD